MKTNRYRLAAVFLKLYIIVVLITAAVLSPLALSAVPIVIVLWYLYLLRWPINSVVVLMTGIFVYFTVNLLYAPHIGDYLSLAVSLPVLGVIWINLEDTATTITYWGEQTASGSKPTSLCMTVLACTGAVLCVAVLTGVLSLLLASILLVLFFGCLGVIAFRMVPPRPVEAEVAHAQIVAGNTNNVKLDLILKAKYGGLLFLRSPYDWMSVTPEDIVVKGEKIEVTLGITPELSGPSSVMMTGQTVDRWGLFRTSFEFEAVTLFVIPRAQYAAWMAEKYMSGTSQGSLPLITNMDAKRSTFGLRQGVEYYGSQLYQPGDSMKNVDWKHSAKYNEMITKEFIEFTGQSAILLTNLSVGNEVEADKLAYNIIVMALSLAQNDIPAALAVYDDKEVKLTTVTLNHQHLVARCLQIAREMVSYVNPVRYLNPPDIGRLRNNIRRIGSTDSEAALKLKDILQIEYTNLSETAKRHPATRALQEAIVRSESRSNIVIISSHNHDVEALAYNTIRYMSRGNAVIEV